jgi:hypothetical protein
MMKLKQHEQQNERVTLEESSPSYPNFRHEYMFRRTRDEGTTHLPMPKVEGPVCTWCLRKEEKEAKEWKVKAGTAGTAGTAGQRIEAISWLSVLFPMYA